MRQFRFAYRRAPDQDRDPPARHPVVVVGAGPVGLAAAIDLALQGIRVVLLDEADRIGEGSRAICFAKRSLEIFDRLGLGPALVEKGITWQRGRVFLETSELFNFDLLPEAGHKMPAFINIQQYYVEAALAARAAELPLIDIRWLNRVIAIAPAEDGATLTIETPDGPYNLAADWVIACDGSRSPLRRAMGLDFAGEAFDDRFLIADVKMTADFPTERWFWFRPPFHSGQSALLHKQPDDIWRIDLQLGRDADVEKERQPERVTPRIARMLGHERFTLEWVSVYTFQCRRLARFVHGRVIFAGDAAHQVSPFGARGANSGIQDAENLAWKLALVLKGEADPSLLATYDLERGAAADENILNSTRATDFIAPASPGEMHLRDAVLALARHTAFAKRMVNSGRLSVPATYETPLSTPDTDEWAGTARLGAPAPDAPLDEGHLSERLEARFQLLTWGPPPPGLPPDLAVLELGRDPARLLATRFDATPGAAILLRPDGHICARWRRPTAAGIIASLQRAKGIPNQQLAAIASGCTAAG